MFGFGPADGRLCVDPGIFAHELKQARREISMAASETPFCQAFVRNHGLASVGLIQQPTWSCGSPFHALRVAEHRFHCAHLLE